MKNIIKNALGFTLIEMLVVLCIAALGFTVVAPNFVKTYQKITVSREKHKLKELLESVKTKSFLRKKFCVIKLINKNMTICEEENLVVFDSIRFKEMTIKINGNGFSDISEFVYYAGSKEEVFEFED